jgi:hypothetical protein
MRACLRVDALVGEAQALNGTAVDQMLLDDFGGIFWLDVAVPDGFGIDDYRRPVFALIQASRLVDSDRAPQACSLRQLLQLRVQFALSIRGARRPGSAFRADIVADKDVALENGQVLLLQQPAYRLGRELKFPHLPPPNRVASARMIA